MQVESQDADDVIGESQGVDLAGPQDGFVSGVQAVKEHGQHEAGREATGRNKLYVRKWRHTNNQDEVEEPDQPGGVLPAVLQRFFSEKKQAQYGGNKHENDERAETKRVV